MSLVKTVSSPRSSMPTSPPPIRTNVRLARRRAGSEAASARSNLSMTWFLSSSASPIVLNVKANPLPDLCTRDFRGRRVFHQIEQRHGAMSAQPRLQVLHTDTDVLTQTCLRNRFARSEIQKILRGHIAVVRRTIDLIRLRHDGVKSVECELHHAGMRDPRAVVSVARFAFFIGTHFRERLLVGRRIVLHRNLGRHSAHREGVSPMTCLDAEERIRAHEMRRHRNERAIGEQEVGFVPEAFDAGKNVIPAAAV